MSWSCRAGQAVRSAAGFSACGDAVHAWSDGSRGLFAVVDALGHGAGAAASASVAASVLGRCGALPLEELFLACDRALRGHRGVVLSAIQVDAGRVRYAGVGNVGLWGPPGAKRPPNAAGVVGRGLRSVRSWELPVEGGQRWALATDGLRSRAMPRALVETRALGPAEAAARLVEVAGRADDDAAVVVVDWSPA